MLSYLHNYDSPVVPLVKLLGRNLAGSCVCALLLVATATVVHGQPFGYVVNAGDPTDDGTHDNLWRVDLATGDADRIGALGLTIPGTNIVQSDVEGLVLETGNFLYGVNDATNSLVYISANSGAAVTPDRAIDNLRLGLDGVELDPGLTFDCKGRLLMSSASRRTLYEIDKNTGRARVIGTEGGLGVRIGDITAFRDEVFGIGINGDEGLYRIDPDAGTATLIGRFGTNISLANAGLDSTSAGNLWAVGTILVGGQPQPSRILRLDRESGAATLGPTTLVGVKSLAISPTNCRAPGTGPEDPGPEDPGRGNDPNAPAAVPVDSPLALLLLALLMFGMAWHSTRR